MSRQTIRTINLTSVVQTSSLTPPPNKQKREEGEIMQHMLKWMEELRAMPPMGPLAEAEQALEAVANLADDAMMNV